MGWRAGAAVTGTATVMLLAVIIQLLWASPLWTFTGGLLLATEGLNLVQSRTGTLDIFVAFWVVLVFVFLLLDRRWIERRTPPPAIETSPGGDGDAAARPKRRLQAPLWRPYRFAAGAAGGAAMATKWSGLTAVVTAIALGFMWEVMRRKRFGVSKPIMKTITTEGFGFVLALLVCAVGCWLTYVGVERRMPVLTPDAAAAPAPPHGIVERSIDHHHLRCFRSDGCNSRRDPLCDGVVRFRVSAHHL
jgi:hypothetical protein